MKSKGFTLLELLAVIALLAVMAGFLGPALARARRAAVARAVWCNYWHQARLRCASGDVPAIVEGQWSVPPATAARLWFGHCRWSTFTPEQVDGWRRMTAEGAILILPHGTDNAK